jgi:hypothetical protein
MDFFLLGMIMDYLDEQVLWQEEDFGAGLQASLCFKPIKQ